LIKIALVKEAREFPFIGTNIFGTQLKDFYSLMFASGKACNEKQSYFYVSVSEELNANLKPYFLPI